MRKVSLLTLLCMIGMLAFAPKLRGPLLKI